MNSCFYFSEVKARQEVAANTSAGELLVPEVMLKSFLLDKK